MEPLESYIMEAARYDHIACFNSMQYLPAPIFTAVLSRMFMLADKSISFEVDDMPQEHLECANKIIGSKAIYNNTEAMARFSTPLGWDRVLEKRQLIFHTPVAYIDVPGTFYRFERTRSQK